jgi:hypothetical protein
MPKPIGLEPGKGIGHGGPGARWHHSGPVAVEGVQEIERGRNEIGGNLSLSNQVHDREEAEKACAGRGVR